MPVFYNPHRLFAPPENHMGRKISPLPDNETDNEETDNEKRTESEDPAPKDASAVSGAVAYWRLARRSHTSVMTLVRAAAM